MDIYALFALALLRPVCLYLGMFYARASLSYPQYFYLSLIPSSLLNFDSLFPLQATRFVE